MSCRLVLLVTDVLFNVLHYILFKSWYIVVPSDEFHGSGNSWVSMLWIIIVVADYLLDVFF